MYRTLPILLLTIITLFIGNDALAQFNESDIVITEISYNPPESGTDSLEYIELLNVGTTSIDMLGYTLIEGVSFTFPSYTLAPGAYVLVASDSVAFFNNFGFTAFQWTSGGLSNSGEDITLYTAPTGGTLLDSVDYDDGGAWPNSTDGNGPSLVLCDPFSDNNLAASWIAATTDAGFSINGFQVYANPGAASNCPPPCPDINAGITADTTFISCFGLSDGAIDLTLNNGVAPFTFIWSNGDTTEDLSGVSSGFYNVSITDANGCQGSFGAFLQQPDDLSVSVTVNSDVSCNGLSDGEVTAVVTGGTAPYSYLWPNNDTTVSVSGVPAGMYALTVTDANGCSLAVAFQVTEPTVLSVSGTQTNVLCNGASTGAIDITVSGGTTAYGYDWGGGITTEDRTGLSAGSYTVTVTDANGCTALDSYTITEPTALNLSATPTNISCNGADNGSIDVTVTGGTTSYSYDWGGGITSEDRTGLAPGNYTLTVTDGNNCTVSRSYPLNEPTALSIGTAVDNVTCNGGNNGAIDITVTGGTTAYSYDWGGGITSEDRTGLSAGTYNVTVTDANGCITGTGITISEPVAITLNANITDAGCNGAANGVIDLTVSNGNSPYSFDWGGSISTEDRTNLTAGNYTVTVTDNSGCTVSGTYSVSSSSAISITGVVTDVTCNTGNDGAIDITVSGGTTPYIYNWSNTLVSIEDLVALEAGTYSVTVVDDSSCSTVASFTVAEPSAITVSGTTIDVDCNGGSTGSIDLNVSGGNGPYSYDWGGGITSEDRTSLAAGTYPVTVTDNSSCTATNSFTISESSDIVISLVPTHIGCSGGTGSVDATITGGSSPYTFVWSNTETTEDISGLAEGSYTLTVTDANGCSQSSTTTVDGAVTLTVTADITDNTCADSTNGALDIAVTGGSGAYTYVWSNSETTEDLTGLAGDTYTVTVTDANSCTGVGSFTVTTLDSCVTGINNVDLSTNDLMVYPNPSTDVLNVALTGNGTISTIELHSLSGSQVLVVEPSATAALVDVSELAEGMYLLTVRTTDGSIGRTKILVSGK